MTTNTFQIQWHELHYIKLSELCAGLPKALKEVGDYAEISFGDARDTMVKGDDVLKWIESAKGDTRSARYEYVRRILPKRRDDCDTILDQLGVLEDRIRAHVGADGLVSMES